MELDIKNTKVLNFNIDGEERKEELVISKSLTGYGWNFLEYALENFYMHQNKPSIEKVNRFLIGKEFLVDGELVLDKNTLLHFSTGFTNVDTVCDILNNGLKCYEKNATKYEALDKIISESNYVVDTWQIESRLKYSDFITDSPTYFSGYDMDRKDFTKTYAPAYSLSQFSSNYIKDIKKGLIFGFDKLDPDVKDRIECRALQSIGFIIDGSLMSQDVQNCDIYSNKALQKEFCGDALAGTKLMKSRYSVLRETNAGVESLGTYGIASYLYGIPGEYILGVVAPFGMLYSNEICKELFDNGLYERFVVSSTGQLLYAPSKELTREENFQMFVENKDKFLLKHDPSYRKVIEARKNNQLENTTWTKKSTISNRALINEELNLDNIDTNNFTEVMGDGLSDM